MLNVYRAIAMLAIFCGSLTAQASSVWFSDEQSVYQIDTATNQITHSIPLHEVHELAVDAKDNSLLAITDHQLLKFDHFGTPVFQINLRSLRLEEARCLTIDPYDSSLWLVDENKFAHLNDKGQLLGVWKTSGSIRAIVLSLDQSLWLLGDKQLAHYSTQGALLGEIRLHKLVKEEPKFLAVDSLANRLWLAGEKQLLQFDLKDLNQPLLNIESHHADVEGVALAPTSGTLWLMSKRHLTSYARDGTQIKTIELETLPFHKPERLVYDPASSSLWLGHKRGISRLDADGLFVATFPVEREELTAIGVSPFMVTPTLTLIQPQQDSYSNNPKHPITLGYDALCSGQPCGFATSYFSNYNLAALLNASPIGNLFAFDPVTGQTNYTPANRMPEGINTLSAQATDGFGHLSNKVDASFTIDTIAPKFLTVSPQSGSVFTTPQAVITGTIDDATASVMLASKSAATNTLPGSPSFRFTVILNAGVNTYTLTATDKAGNTTSQTLLLNYMPVSISLGSPSSGATINGDTVQVSGTFQGPANTGITVNGVVATQDGNRFYAEVPLASGINSVTATATTPEGITTTQTISVSSSGAAPIRISMAPKSGIAPLNTSLGVLNNTANPISKIQIDFDGNGSIDYTGTDPNAPMAFTYTAPGVYQAQVTVTDSLGTVYTLTQVVVVQDIAKVDAVLRASYNGMVGNLKQGNIDTALTVFSGGAYEKYKAVFTALQPNLASIVDQLGTITDGTISGDMAEYTLVRNTAAGSQAFLIYFIRSEDGVWRIDGM